MEKVITITFGEDIGFVSKNFSSEQSLKTIANLKKNNLYIDGSFNKEHNSVTAETMKNASCIMVQNQLIGA